MKIKALTLIQPWATLIALGEKQIETRSWSPNFKGKLAIHAGLKIDLDACGQPWIKAALAKHGITIPEKLPTGCVIATCTIFDYVQMAYNHDAKHEVEVPGYKLSNQEYALGHYEHGRWAWILANVILPDEHIPARGKQRLWDFETTKVKVHGKGWS
jgi:hypothetical protein